ncbi:2-oxo acid dehydrogenase subunit E2 [Aeromicrobium senzhongii]|uniref:Dihydrolipoamide acetyltransferase component of pyruvate dehydrogenase complex n=1 Tax=Aeromicrobium senzhongii TaxID=2663859 RepID=A0ABX6SS34_9ACTN|nr:dihydrolipoamide acetyltransferase family protein [Aeromicrobium senzhongii]MTB89656.1 2-oxo acid dehydrogenase subunit E2 [Aeromicrobium senzhongii]QNL94218.1 2-oxo acid dehydrogenase subunit E2 [Aeromicrobium senzhongii]
MSADSPQVFRLPDVGEGLTEAEIVTWHVAVGDEVKVNDPLVDIETAKSIVELPSPFAGSIGALLVQEGEMVQVGTAIVHIGGGVPLAEPLVESPAAEERREVLVGYGPSSGRRRTRNRVRNGSVGLSLRVLAKPPVRKLAKDLGIDLSKVPSRGDAVTRAEVEEFARVMSGTATTAAPVTGVRRATAEAMIASVQVPQATEWVTVDVSATVDLMDRLKADRRFADVKVTSTLLTARAVCLALARTPDLHARWNESTIEHPASVGLGIAAATDRGLVVPVVREAERLPLVDLGRAIDELVATARAGRIQPDQMSGGTFTLTNVGVFGVDGGTPILPPGQSGILALGQVARRPWVVDEQVVPRWVTTLAVTFDHRVADGAQASRFLADVATILQDPAMALAY